MIEQLKNFVLQGGSISFAEAQQLAGADLKELCRAAQEIRAYYCADYVDTCTIINGKNGGCTEDCKFCAQSSHYQTSSVPSSLTERKIILQTAKYHASRGVKYYSIVTAGRTLQATELADLCQTYKTLRQNCQISLCASHGLLTYQQLAALKQAGVTRYHNNLETSRRYFPKVCSTHTYEDKIQTILAAQKAGLEVCSGGIIGLGESMQDRLQLAFALRKLRVNSVPLNILSPINGTPLQAAKALSLAEIRRVFALYRFILPKAFLRLAGGRGQLRDRGKMLFLAGANAAITGDLLTTAGFDLAGDREMFASLGFKTTLQ